MCYPITCFKLLSFLLAFENKFLVPPESGYKPDFIQGNLKTGSSNYLAGPYLENLEQEFSCHIHKVLPGKESTLFEFYYDGNLRLQSKDNVGRVVESDEPNHTKHVKWIFTTSFNKSDNGGKMLCCVNWKEGQYNREDLKSIPTENVQVVCKYPTICSRTFIM